MARDKNEAINSYITDMLALEDHIEKALRGQLEDLKDYPDVIRELNQIHHKVEHHISDLKLLSERRSARRSGRCHQAGGFGGAGAGGRGHRPGAPRGAAEEPAGRLHGLQPGHRSGT